MMWTLGSLTVLVLTALLLGTTFAHVLEAPAKFQYDAAQWVFAQQNLYRSFASIGGAIELSAIAATIGYAFLLRNDASFVWAIVAAVLIAMAFAVWVFVTASVNARVETWSLDAIPTEWRSLRMQWEYSHIVRWVAHLVGFISLATAALRTQDS